MPSNLYKNVQKPLCNARGFKLVELMIVVGIGGILLTTTIYSWSKFVNNNNLRSAARYIMEDIAQYRQRTVAESTVYTMTFNVSGNSYTISPGNITKKLSLAGPGITFQSVCLPACTTNIITMQTRGLLNNGTIVLQNNRNSTATITVNTAGRTYVQFTMQ